MGLSCCRRPNLGLAVEGEHPLAPRRGRQEPGLGKRRPHELYGEWQSVFGETTGYGNGGHPGRAPWCAEVRVTSALQPLGSGRADRRREQRVVAHGQGRGLRPEAVSNLLGSQEDYGGNRLTACNRLTNLRWEFVRMSGEQFVVGCCHLRLHHGT